MDDYNDKPTAPNYVPLAHACKPKVQPRISSCCCFSLRVGCLTLGWLRMIISVGLFGFAMYLFTIRESEFQFFAIIFTIASVLDIARFTVLLTGVYCKNPKCLKVFVGICIGFMVFSAINLARSITQGPTVFSQLGVIAFEIFVALVADSYATELKNGPPEEAEDTDGMI